MQIRQRILNWVDLQIQAHYQQNCSFVVSDRYIVAVGGSYQGNVGPNNHPMKILDIDVVQPPLNPPDRFFCPTPTTDSILVVQEFLPLRDFSACFYGKNKIIIFGGRGANNVISNEVYVLTLQEQDNTRGRYVNFKRQVTFNNDNYGRFGHTAHIYRDTMYVIGGTTQNGQSNFQILKLSLTTPYTWERINIPRESPHDTINVTRWSSGHKSVLKDEKIYVYNGDERYPIQHINEHLYMMNLANQQLRWERIQAPSLNPRQEPLNIDEMLEMNNKLYFFERNPATQLTNPLKMHSYDIRQNQWDLAPVGQPEGMPDNFKLIAYRGRFILWGYVQLFPFNGRIFSLNLDGNNFPGLPQIERQIPETLNWDQRHQQAPRHEDSSLVVIGKYIVAVGSNPEHIAIYNAKTKAFAPVAFTPGLLNLRLAQFSVCAYKENKIIIFGGRTNINNIINRVLVISLQEDERGIFANCKVHETINNNEGRAGHSAHIYENTMYVIGGEAGLRGDNNLILKLSLNAPYTWESVNIPNDVVNNPNWTFRHKSVLKNGKIYVYTEDMRFPIRYVNENLYVIDLTEQQLRWRKVQAPSLEIPKEPLNFNDMLEIDNKLYFFERNPPGQLTYPKNLHIYSLGTNKWDYIGAGCLGRVPDNFKLVAYQNQIVLWEYLNQNNVVNGIIYTLGENDPDQELDYSLQIRKLEQEKRESANELQIKQGELANRDARIRALENDKTRLENDIRTTNENIRGLEARRQNLERERVAEENRMGDLITERRNKQFESERRRIEGEINGFRTQLQVFEAQVAGLDGIKRGLEGELRNARNQNRVVEERKNQCQGDLQSVRRRRDDEERKVGALKNQLNEQHDLSTSAEDETEQTKRNLADERREISGLHYENDKLEKQIKSYTLWLVFLLIGLMSLFYKKL